MEGIKHLLQTGIFHLIKTKFFKQKNHNPFEEVKIIAIALSLKLKDLTGRNLFFIKNIPSCIYLLLKCAFTSAYAIVQNPII